MDYRIRPASEADAESIISMIQEFAAVQGLSDQCKLTAEDLIRDGFGKNPAFHCLIAEVKSKDGDGYETVGYSLYYFIYYTYKGKNIYLEDLYVKPDYRNNGVGGDLVKTIHKIGLENGCLHCRLLCQDLDTTALNFFKSIGAQDMTHLERWKLLCYEKPDMIRLAGQVKKPLTICN